VPEVTPMRRRLSLVRRDVGWLDIPAYTTTPDDGSDAAVDLTKIGRPGRSADTGNVSSETSGTWLGNVADRGGDETPYG
jgi:hypothetical protein